MPVSSAPFKCSAHSQGMGTNRFITILHPNLELLRGDANTTIRRGSGLPSRGRKISEFNFDRDQGHANLWLTERCGGLFLCESIFFSAATFHRPPTHLYTPAPT